MLLVFYLEEKNMGHQIYHQTYSEKINRRQVQQYWDNVAMHDDWEEGCTGLPANIRWIENHICNSYDDAVEYIRKNDRGYYDQLAIRYRDSILCLKTKTEFKNSKISLDYS